MHVMGRSNNRNACALERQFFCSNETVRISVDISRHRATNDGSAHGTESNAVSYHKRKLSNNSCFRSCPRGQFLFTMLQLSSTLYQERWVSLLLLQIVCHSGQSLRCMTIEKLVPYLLPNLFCHCLYWPLAHGI
jgi:hypothetical protein